MNNLGLEQSSKAALAVADESLKARPGDHRRRNWYLIFLGALVLAFLPILLPMANYAVSEDLHSHILLIPFVTAYLLWINKGHLPREYQSSILWAIGALVIGVAGLAAGLLLRGHVSGNDYFALMALSLVGFAWAGGFFWLGRRWMQAAVFPMAFLIFLVPLPDGLVARLEHLSVLGSAEAAAFFFWLSGTPTFREGVVFQLPGMLIQVAQECSGIRSSWVLFITSLVAAHIFLQSRWRRFFLVAFVIPLGLLRNGFRIMVIGLLCVHLGPHMIHSIVHRKGGPIFFVLSLVPLFALLWWLRRGDAGGAPIPEKGTTNAG